MNIAFYLQAALHRVQVDLRRQGGEGLYPLLSSRCRILYHQKLDLHKPRYQTSYELSDYEIDGIIIATGSSDTTKRNIGSGVTMALPRLFKPILGSPVK